MTSPRQFVLFRAADLRAFRRAIGDAVSSRSVAERGDSVVIVPTHAAGALLQPLFDARRAPHIVTRGGLYEQLHERLGGPPLLQALDREVLMRRAARTAIEQGAPPPFRLRPGLVGEMVAFYDELQRRRRTLGAFERLTVEALEPSAEFDRGASRLLEQTRFLSAAFRDYERRLEADGRLDEHGLRRFALGAADVHLCRQVVVTVADQAADSHGLWPADMDLLARLPGLVRLDVVTTERTLASGFHQRVHDLLPGIEEIEVQDEPSAPTLMVPPEAERRFFLARDREEELVEFARVVKGRARSGRVELDRVAVIFQRPLPYLYLARHVFADARIPWRASDALPLAAEPFAAAVDLVLTFVTAGHTRLSGRALLKCPWFQLDTADEPVAARDIDDLDRALVASRFVGGIPALEALATQLRPGPARAARAMVRAARELEGVSRSTTASGQIRALASFLRNRERTSAAQVSEDRTTRAREAILAALDSLATAHARYDDDALETEELAGTIRRWMESQTFAPPAGERGVRLTDASAAKYGSFDEARIVGLVEADWPDRPSRGIFYPTSLLNQLGWTPEAERLAGARASFADLLQLPSAFTSASAFMLEEDALVAPSAFAEEIDVIGLRTEKEQGASRGRMFVHEALADSDVNGVVTGAAAEWLAARRSRTPASDARYKGFTGAQTPTPYAVNAVEQYLACPFKYFATSVLDLEEEREEEAGLTRLERGRFVHEVLCEFFAAWQNAGRGAITVQNLELAIDEFSRIAERRLATLSEADRALERNHLLGSAAASGLAERAFAFELERSVPVLERLLEHRLEGTFRFTSGERSADVQLRGKADRIDVLPDRSIRVIDYKLRKAPNMKRALQLPIYAAAATQSLDVSRGGPWRLAEAGYVAFGERQPFVRLGGRQGDPERVEEAVDAGQALFLDSVQAIERGEFPVKPDEPYMCRFCAYSSVCRKDYVGDE